MTGLVPDRPLRAVLTAVRGGVLRRAGRVRGSAWPILQSAIGAALAWQLAVSLLDHEAPFFAAVAATVCLGVSFTQRLRRVVELAAGVTIGVAVGDLLISGIGRGVWQLACVVALGMAVAQVFGSGTLITAQAGLQGVFLVGLPQPDHGFARWQDALVGGAVALFVAAALPPDPLRRLRPFGTALITELSDVVRLAAAAVREGDASLAESALERARSTQGHLDRWQSALRDGEEISRISPLRRGRRADLARYRRALTGVDRAARNMRVALRRIDAVLDRGEPVPQSLAGVLDQLAGAIGELDGELHRPPGPSAVQERLTSLAGWLDPVALSAESLSATVVVGQIRSTVVDLLEATGMPTEEARAVLPR